MSTSTITPSLSIPSPKATSASYLRSKNSESFNNRYRRLRGIEDRGIERYECLACADDPVHWISNWVYTYDPRLVSQGVPSTQPFDLFPRQEELIRWLGSMERASKPGLVEKSRDTGVSWLCCAYAVHGWLFRPGYAVGFGSLKFEEVDQLGNMDTLLEKCRFIVDNLPSWMRPNGYVRSQHAKSMCIINPENGSTITGEGGDDMGRGGRKAQPLDSLVLTPRGYVRMGDIVVGSIIVGANGVPSRVLAVTPQGVKKVYRVRFSDGSSAECCDDHLWTVTSKIIRKARNRKIRRNLLKPRKSIASVTLPLSEIRKTMYVGARKEPQYQIPLVGQVDFLSEPLPLDPYLVGALLGDGAIKHIDRTCVAFTTSETEMIDNITRVLPTGIQIVQNSKYGYSIVMGKGKGNGKHGLRHPIKQGLRSIGLAGKGSEDKFVPDIYKFTSFSNRLAILQGLMDTDGWCSARTNSCRIGFSSASKTLADDVVFLVRSLGGTATIGVRETPRLPAWSLSISMPDGINPFRLSRKANAVIPRVKYRPVRTIVGVDEVGEKECQCISVDADDGLYLTNDFIVTHNSIFVVDESAMIKRPELVNAALSRTTDVRIDVSTPKGMNAFYRRRQSLPVDQVFRIHWRDDPRYDDEWYAAMQAQLGDPVLVAQELDISYAGSEYSEWPAEFFDGIMFTDWPADLGTMTRVMACDPSKGKGDKAGDYSVWVMMAIDANLTLWVDADMDNGRPVEPLSTGNGRSIVTDGLSLVRRFDPAGVLIEVNGFQEWVARALQRVAFQANLVLPIYTVNHMVAKVQRMKEALSPFLSQRRIRIKDTAGGRLLVQQMREVPNGTHDDGPDCVTTAIEMANKLIYGGESGVHALVG